MSQPRIIIIAGPNGAGKTTFAREFLPKEAGCRAFLNADLIAAGLSPLDPDRAAIQAGRLILKLAQEHVGRRESFAIETTLSGRGYVRQIAGWREAGYVTRMHFLSLPSAEQAIRRVAQRVSQGGHNIPEEVIRRRFEAGRRLFDTVYKSTVDDWTLYDNSGDSTNIVDWKGNVMPVNQVSEPLPTYNGLPPHASEQMKGAYAALLRAAANARKLARQTGTQIVVVRDGQIVNVSPGPEEGSV